MSEQCSSGADTAATTYLFSSRPVWVSGSMCVITVINPPRFLAECRKRRLNEGSFVLLFLGCLLCLIVSADRYIATTTLAIISVFLEYLGQFLIDLHQGVAYALSIGTEINDLGWPWTHSFKIHAFSEPIKKIWMKIDPYYQRQRCSAMTVVSGNIRLCG